LVGEWRGIRAKPKLTQEAFMQLFRKIHTFRGESMFSTWLYRVTANVVLIHFRKKKLMAASLEDILTDAEDDSVPRLEFGLPDLRLTGLFDRVNLRMAIDQLPARYRANFILHDVQGYEHNKIAESLGCSVGTSKSQLHMARERLHQILKSIQHFVLAQSQ
jgi:RNA polymerase sigma-70 factor, ECF subfamily